MCVNESYQCLMKAHSCHSSSPIRLFHSSAEVCKWEDNNRPVMDILGTHLILTQWQRFCSIYRTNKHQHKKKKKNVLGFIAHEAHSPCALSVSQLDSGVTCHWHLQLSQGVFQLKPVLNSLYMFWTLCMCFRFFYFAFSLYSQNAINELPIYPPIHSVPYFSLENVFMMFLKHCSIPIQQCCVTLCIHTSVQPL